MTRAQAVMMDKIAQIDVLLDHGSMNEARALVRPLLESKRIPRPLLASLARLCRRLRLSGDVIQLLHRTVRAAPNSAKAAQDPEIAEYAAAMVDLGGSEEAIELLSKVDLNADASYLLFLAFAHNSLWEYSKSAEVLRRMIDHPKLTEYGKWSSRVHLANALIFGGGDLHEALDHLDTVLDHAHPGRFRPIFKYALLFKFQADVLYGDRSGAQQLLRQIESETATDHEPEYDSHFMFWKAFASLNREGATGKVRSQLANARQGLESRGDWETIRLADFLVATKTDDRKTLAKLYYGSPYSELRERVVQACGGLNRLPEQIIWDPQSESARSSPRQMLFDVQLGQFRPSSARLKRGQAIHRLLFALCEDFYKPKNLVMLHRSVFPESYLNANSYGDRVHQVILRTRRWIAKNRLPIEIFESQGTYRLLTHGKCVCLLRRQSLEKGAERSPVSSNYTAYLERVSRHFGPKNWFKASEMARLLEISHRAAGLYLKAALEQGHVERGGSGPSTRFKLAPLSSD